MLELLADWQWHHIAIVSGCVTLCGLIGAACEAYSYSRSDASDLAMFARMRGLVKLAIALCALAICLWATVKDFDARGNPSLGKSSLRQSCQLTYAA